MVENRNRTSFTVGLNEKLLKLTLVRTRPPGILLQLLATNLQKLKSGLGACLVQPVQISRREPGVLSLAIRRMAVRALNTASTVGRATGRGVSIPTA